MHIVIQIRQKNRVEKGETKRKRKDQKTNTKIYILPPVHLMVKVKKKEGKNSQE
jgi:hypothetical protein